MGVGVRGVVQQGADGLVEPSGVSPVVGEPCTIRICDERQSAACGQFLKKNGCFFTKSKDVHRLGRAVVVQVQKDMRKRPVYGGARQVSGF